MTLEIIKVRDVSAFSHVLKRTFLHGFKVKIIIIKKTKTNNCSVTLINLMIDRPLILDSLLRQSPLCFWFQSKRWLELSFNRSKSE